MSGMTRGVTRGATRGLTLGGALLALLCVATEGQAKPPAVDKPRASAASAPRRGPGEKSVQRSSPKRVHLSQDKGEEVFRFDALRIEGLAGPNALVLRQLAEGKRRSLLRRRRSFVHRVFTTLEASAGPARSASAGRAQ